MAMKGIQIQVTQEQDAFIERQRTALGLSKSAYVRVLLGQAMNGTGQALALAQNQTGEQPIHQMKEPQPLLRMTAEEAVNAIMHCGKKVKRIEFVMSLRKLLQSGNQLYAKQITALQQVYYSVFDQSVTISDGPRDVDHDDEWNRNNGYYLNHWKYALNVRRILFRALKFNPDDMLTKEIKKLLQDISLTADNDKITNGQNSKLMKIRKRLPGRLQLYGAPVSLNTDEVLAMIQELRDNPEHQAKLNGHADFNDVCDKYPNINEDTDMWSITDVEHILRWVLKRPVNDQNHKQQQLEQNGGADEEAATTTQLELLDKDLDRQAEEQEFVVQSLLFH